MTAPTEQRPTLLPGTRLGPYEVLAPLGSGGMGEVYRARDGRLGREVAVKVLPAGSSADPDRLRRFEQEARAAGALNHPNLVAVFDTGRREGNPYVVFELLDGVTLRQRLGGGPLPARKAVDYAVQIADGLAAAHDKGIVHRDLKPENLFVTRDGRVKILDFGLAKLRPALDPHAPREEGATVSAATGAGVVLGTVGYLSPEQVRGDPADHRSDIFSFGAVFHEMLSGRRPFMGETAAEVMTAILKEDSPELAKPDIPPGLERLVRRCLEKRPDERFQSARDVRFALEAVSGARSIQRPRAWLAPIAAALAVGAVIGGLAAWRLWRPDPRHETPATGVVRFTWSLPGGLELDSAPVVSPDSRSIAFTATDASGSGARLFVRALDRLEASVIADTEGAKQPFWSPDSRSLGYFANGSLMKVALASGAPVRICDAPEARGGSWSRSGIIVFTPAMIDTALARVSADGGQAEPATLLDVTKGEDSHRWPAFLPDGVHFLYFVHSSVDERRGVYLGRVDRPASRPAYPLFRSESAALYAPLKGGDGDVLLSVANGRVAARPFDAERLALVGDPRMIDLQAGGHTLSHPAMLSASAELLAAVSTPMPYGSRLTSTGRNGEDLRLWKERESQSWPRLSPDGRRLARQRIGVTPALWVEDLERSTRVRVATVGLFPVWSPDGSRLAYVTGTRTQPQLVLAAADGTGGVTVRPCPRAYCLPTDWSPDGRSLIVNLGDELDGKWEVWALSPEPKGPAQPLLAEPFTERDARLSPDGHWIAYVSEESGRPEVSVRHLSGAPRRIVISGGGGDQPVWRRDGAELFFVDPQGRLRSVAVRRGEDTNLTFGVPVEVKVPPFGSGHWGTQYDVSPDGRRVYFLDLTREPAPREIAVVLGWRALLGSASTRAEAGN